MNFRCSKAIQLVVLLTSVWALSACEVLKQVTQQSSKQAISENSLCLTQAQEEKFEAFCDISQWLAFTVDAKSFTWSERMQMIAELDEEASSLVQKIILSQGADTPYQHRLRAQNWIENINVDASDVMQILLNDLIYENSKQLLEFESAITILSRVNSRQEKIISELELKLLQREQKIQKQQDQVEQLLKIETDLIEQNRNEKR